MRLTGTRIYYRPSPPTMPPGLVELMEGLTREVLKHNPSDIYGFCASHVHQLLEKRDGPSNKKPMSLEAKIARAQEKIRQRAASRRQEYDKNLNVQRESNELLKNDIIDEPVQITQLPVIQVFHSNDEIDNKSDVANDYKSLKPPVHGEHLSENLSEMEISHGNNKSNAGIKNFLDVTAESSKHENTCLLVNYELSESKDDTSLALNEKDIKSSNESVENESTDNVPSLFVPKENEKQENATVLKQDIHPIEIINKISALEAVAAEIIALNNNTNESGDEIQTTTQTQDENQSLSTTESNIDYKSVTNDKQNTNIIETNQNSSNDTYKSNSIDDIQNTSNTENMENNEITKDTQNSINQSNTYDNKNIQRIDECQKSIEIENSVIQPNSIQNVSVIQLAIISENNNIDECSDIQTNTNVTKIEHQDMIKGIENTEMLDRVENSQVSKQNEIAHHIHKTINDTIELCSSAGINDKNVNIVQEIDTKEDTPETVTNEKTKIYKHLSSGTCPDTVLSSTINEQNNKDNKIITDMLEMRIENNIASESETHPSLPPSGVDNEISTLVTVELKNNIQEINDVKNISSQTIEDGDGSALFNLPENIHSYKENVHASNEEITNDNSDLNIKSIITPSGAFVNPKDNINQGDNADDKVQIEGHESSNMNLETAAVTIQKVFRTFLFKSKGSTFEDSTNDEIFMDDDDKNKDEMEFPVALNIDRRAHGITRMDTVLQTVNEEKSLSLSDDSSTLSSAATIIQAHVRGFLVRSKLNSTKTTSSNSLAASNSNEPSITSLEADIDQNKNKTILNIRIVPEGESYLSRDESLMTSMELSLDSSPPSSINLHPLGYDKSERRKQLKREDAIQSVSPPSNNSGKLSEDLDSVKDLPLHEDETMIDQESIKDSDDTSGIQNGSIVNALEDEIANRIEKIDPDTELNQNKKSLTRMSSDEMDVVTPIISNEASTNSKIMHMGELHDTALPTRVSRSDTTVVSEFKTVLVYFLLWNNP